jgi:AraC family transcriptional regulator
MSADRILKIQDGTTYPLVSRPKFSSTSVPWAGFLLEECVVPMEINRHLAVEKPTICLCTNGQGITHWKRNGVLDRYRIVKGSVCVWSSDYELETSWVSKSWEIVLLALDTSKFRHHAPLETKAIETSLVGFHFAEDPTVAKLVSEMDVEAKAGCPSGALYAQSLSLALLSYLTARYAHIPPSNGRNGGLSPAQKRRVMRLIRDNLGLEVTVSDLAQSISVSPSYFYRAFKASFGMTPHNFITRERVAEAKQMLTESHWSVAYIAAELGFSSHSHFTRIFHKLTGVTPRQFRDRQ